MLILVMRVARIRGRHTFVDKWSNLGDGAIATSIGGGWTRATNTIASAGSWWKYRRGRSVIIGIEDTIRRRLWLRWLLQWRWWLRRACGRRAIWARRRVAEFR